MAHDVIDEFKQKQIHFPTSIKPVRCSTFFQLFSFWSLYKESSSILLKALNCFSFSTTKKKMFHLNMYLKIIRLIGILQTNYRSFSLPLLYWSETKLISISEIQ